MSRPTLTLTGTMSSQEDVKEQYRDAGNLRARAAIYRFGTNNIPWTRWVFDQLDLPTNARVLEIGCGAGGLWRANAERIPVGWRLTLADLSPGMIDASREAIGSIPHVKFLQANAQELPFTDGEFDGVVANHMLYHVPDIPITLREIRRVLRPTGKLYATTNGEDHLQRMKELIYDFLGDESAIAQPMPFSLDNAQRLLSGSFSRVELRSFHDELRITDPDAIVAYVMSIHTAPQRLIGARYQQLLEAARSKVADGAWIVKTHAGMCVATR